MGTLSPALQKLIKDAKGKYERNTSRIYKLKEGKTTVRILPKGEDKFWQDLGVHWIKMDKNAKPVAVVGCRDVCFDQPCPIDTAIEKAKKAAVDDESLAIIKDWAVRKSVLVNALIRKGDGASESEVQILELKPKTFSSIMSICEEYGDLFDPKTGIDLVIERKGKMLDTEYTVMPAPKSEPVPKGVLEKVIDLRDFVEKEFFRGDEPKALNAIANYTGIDVSGIAGPSTTTKRLTASTVEDPEGDMTEEKLTPKAAPKAAAPKVEEKAEEPPFEADTQADESDLEDILADLDNI